MEYANLIMTVIVALLACFFGYKLNKVMIALFGFIAGYHLGTTIANTFTSSNELTILLSVVIGLVIGFISFKLYLAGVFVTCFMLTYILCQTTIEIGDLKPILSIVCGVIVGFLGVTFTRPMIMVTTSLGGAFLLTDTLLTFFHLSSPIVNIVAGLLVAFIAFGYQQRTNPDES